MIGSLRWNITAGFIGFFGTLAASLPNNVWKTALLQSFYSFLFLFFLLFAVRWVLGFLTQAAHQSSQTKPRPQDSSAIDPVETPAPRVGRTIDYSTPDEDVPMAAASKAQAEEQEAAFAPLNPPKLTTKVNQVPEDDLVKAFRQMSDE